MNPSTSLHGNVSDESSYASVSLPSILTQTTNSISPLVQRVALATVIFPHGAQKLLGWFGGYGFKGTMAFFTGTMGIPWLLALGVVLIEFFAPILLLIGLGTRIAALGLAVVMTTAMLMVHVQNGFFMNWFGAQKGEGIEYFLLLLGLAISLLISGAGRFSVDRNFHKNSSL